MEQESLLRRYRKEIDDVLSQFFERELKTARKLPRSIVRTLLSVRDFTMQGGKRLRPILVILGYQAVGGKGLRDILKTSIAVELMQSFLLIHDDIIDMDSLRRGRPTVHEHFKSAMKGINGCDSDHCGKSMAILAGDLCSALGTRIILDSGFSDERKIAATKVYAGILNQTIYGQILDINSGLTSYISESTIKMIHLMKTAIYTLDGPLLIGAVLGGGTRDQKKALSNYAIPLGQAYQIKDDILGIFGEESIIGKPVGSDLSEGKKTLLLLRAIDNANPKEKLYLKKMIGKKSYSKPEIERVKKIIVETGSLEYSEKKAKILARKAKTAIKSEILDREVRETLSWLADFVISRKI